MCLFGFLGFFNTFVLCLCVCFVLSCSFVYFFFFFSSRRRHTRCALVTGVQTCALPIYLHWPFCRSKCPYCDFNSHVRESIDQARWRAALLSDLEHAAAKSGPRRVSSVFFGGGTPSLMPAETVAAALEKIAALWGLPAGTEVTLEANPPSAEAARFAAFARAGVYRLSLGVQEIGRAHV